MYIEPVLQNNDDKYFFIFLVCISADSLKSSPPDPANWRTKKILPVKRGRCNVDVSLEMSEQLALLDTLHRFAIHRFFLNLMTTNLVNEYVKFLCVG